MINKQPDGRQFLKSLVLLFPLLSCNFSIDILDLIHNAYCLINYIIHNMRFLIHDVSAFTIGNTLTETWRGPVMRSYSSIDKSNFLCVFDYVLHAPNLTTF